MGGGPAHEPSVQGGLRHFLKVTKSYWPGLFGCYQASDLPRTNNDLEHAFGSHRYHRRRASRPASGLARTGGDGLAGHLESGDSLRPEEGLVLRQGYVRRWQELAELEALARVATEAAPLPS